MLDAQYQLLKKHMEEEGGIRIRHDGIMHHLSAQIEGAQDLLLTLNDPDIPDGTVIARADFKGALLGSFAERVSLHANQRHTFLSSREEIDNG